MFAKRKPVKRKRTRNTGKTAKIGSHGLKVYKGTKVYIGKATSGGVVKRGETSTRSSNSKSIYKYVE